MAHRFDERKRELIVTMREAEQAPALDPRRRGRAPPRPATLMPLRGKGIRA
jgi:hypothetical protein